MFELLGGLIGGAFSYFGAKDQMAESAEQYYYKLLLMQKIGKELRGEYQDVIDRVALDPAGYAGTKVKPAEYRAVDTSRSQREAISGNLENSGLINQLVSGTNRRTLDNDIFRAERFDPRSMSTIMNLGEAASALSRGQMPQDVIEDLISRRQSQVGSIGTPGGAESVTMRDLGLSSLDAFEKSAGLLNSVTRGMEAISPIARQIADPQFFLSPQTKLSTDLTQAQLIQNSEQNKFNLMAAPDPGKNLMAQLQIQGANTSAAMKAGAASIPQPQFPTAQIYGQIGNTIGNAIAGLGGGSGYGGGYNSGFGSGGGYNWAAMASDPYAFNSAAYQYNQSPAGQSVPKAYIV